jgi:hypothetical protein
LFDGVIQVEKSNQCSAYNNNQNKYGARWLPRSMGVGDEFTSSMTLFTTLSDTNTCCSSDYNGELPTQTIKLVERINLDIKNTGNSENDVLHFAVTSGARAGEHFYYARGKGLVAYELINSRGNVCRRAYAY